MNQYTQTENSQTNLQIGRPFEYRLLTAQGDVGAYECRIPGADGSFAIIAHIPDAENWERCQPTSVVTAFETAEAAIKTLERWASDPVPPPLPKPPRTLNHRRNGTRPRQRDDSVDQLFLDL
jgi:hypothetical protein